MKYAATARSRRVAHESVWPIVVLACLLPVAATAATEATTANPSPAPPSGPAERPADPCITSLAVVTRPSVTTSPCAVKRGHVAIETGYQNTTADGGVATAQYPQAFIRVGASVPNLEFSIAPPTIERSAATIGSSDGSFGAKYELGYGSKWIYAVNAFVTEPTGTNGYSANGTAYTVNLDLSYALTPGVSVASTLGYNNLSDGTHRWTSLVPSLVASATVTASTTIFGEVATFSHAVGPAGSTRVQFLAGIQQAVANRLQFDLEAGRSPTASTGKYRYVGIGLSYAQF